jgi:hypothetical protein
MPFEDRLLESTYEKDALVQISVGDSQVPVPARLWKRLQAIARGYELEVLPSIGDGTSRLEPDRAGILTDELDFLYTAVNDVLVRTYASRVRSLARASARSARGSHLVIEAP